MLKEMSSNVIEDMKGSSYAQDDADLFAFWRRSTFRYGFRINFRDEFPGGTSYKNDGVLVGNFEKNP